MAEATNKNFVTQSNTGTYQEGIVTATMNSDDTITLDVEETKVAEIKSAVGHVVDTGLPLQFSYDDNVLKLETAAQSGADVFVRILY